MKIKLPLLSFLIVLIIASSCTKNTTVTHTIYDTTTTIDTPFQMPVKGVLDQGILVDTVIYSASPSTHTEVGTEFYSSDTGTISQLGGLFAVKNQNYTVSLWDAVADTLLTSAIVTTTDTTVFAYQVITPVHISANKLYIISLNSAPSALVNVIGSKSTSTVAFPYSIGNITFVGTYYTTSAAFPTIPINNFVTSADFVFKVTK
jgi:hypothetical protein